MNALLDERFPNLESLNAFLDSESGNPDNIQAAASAREAERKKRDAHERDSLIERRQAAIQDAVAQGVPLTNGFSEETQKKLIDVLKLKQERVLVKRAIDLMSYLAENPSNHAQELKQSLVDLEGNESELAVTLLETIRSKWYDSEMNDRLAHLTNVLEKSGWPKSDPPANSTEVSNAVKRAIELELPGKLSTSQVFARPIIERIMFNFQPGRDTVRADKSEWLFAYVTKLLDPRVRWVNGELRKYMSEPIEKLLIAVTPALIKLCRENYAIDSNFVSQLLSFISEIESRYWCSSETTDKIAFGILDPEWLELYLLSEQKNYGDLLETLLKTGSQKLDLDANVPSAKPTFVAENLQRMLQEAKYLVRLDPEFVLNNIHLALTRRYAEWLENQLDIYDRSHSSLARAVGTNKEVLPKDVEDLEFLARLFGASSYFRGIMENWSTDLDTAIIRRELDRLIESFGDLRSKAGSRIANTVTRETQRNLKPYFASDWKANDVGDEKTFRTASSFLRSTVEALRSSINLLDQLCRNSKSDRARIMVQFSDSMAKVFWRLVIQANVFTFSGAGQLRADIEYFWASLDLPKTSSFYQNIEATGVLQGEEASQLSTLSKDQVDGLERRRVENNA